MNSSLTTRRRFLTAAAGSLGAVAVAPRLLAAKAETKPSWPIGCLNRPWVKWSLTEMLDGVQAAGYRILGLQTPTTADPFVGKEASAEYLADLKAKIAARGLHATLGRLRTQETQPYAEATAEIRTQLDNAKTLGLTAVINTGTNKPEHYDAWYRTMAFASAYAADRGIQVVIKPHGGVTAAAADLLVCLEKIKHPNLRLWYDAGNVIYYTGKDSLAELEPIVSHVTTFTAKDCAEKNAEVMVQFGTGKVDFAGIFRRLKKAGFNGPIMVESCKVGATAAETTANAKANREFLERILATV